MVRNELEDRTKGSENPGFRSFLRILIGIGTGLRIGGKDLDPFLENQVPIQSFCGSHFLWKCATQSYGLVWTLSFFRYVLERSIEKQALVHKRMEVRLQNFQLQWGITWRYLRFFRFTHFKIPGVNTSFYLRAEYRREGDSNIHAGERKGQAKIYYLCLKMVISFPRFEIFWESLFTFLLQKLRFDTS